MSGGRGFATISVSSSRADTVDNRARSPQTLFMLPPLRDVIARHGLNARHALGQHFLLDTNLTARIAREAGDLTGRHVIEIGPGPGGLTRALLDTDLASLTVIEVDRRAIAAIGELAAVDSRLTVIEADATRLDVTSLTPSPRRIVANLPYNVASPLLVGWLRQAASFERMTLMFQLEVAERICADPGTAAYGRLGVLARWRCEVGIALRLPPQAFVPPPKVSSAVVTLIPRAETPSPTLFAAMERLTAAAFGQRRKMLRGALKPLGGEALLSSADIAPNRRAETLSIAEFDRLARLIAS
jgi:16S rRNA (adenine1518-N6/adenine1519-N6)-dimethyltransferase